MNVSNNLSTLKSLKIKTPGNRFFLIYSIFSTIFILTLFTYCLYWIGQYRESQNLISELNKVYTSPTSTQTYIPTGVRSETTNCIKENTTIFYEKNKAYAACLENGKYNVYRKTFDDTFTHMYEETGRYESGTQVLISYADYYNPNTRTPQSESGSKIFKIDKNKNELLILISADDIPNKDLWITGTEYSIQFIIPDINNSKEKEWMFSPDNNILILKAVSCTGCQTTMYLYGYNFQKDRLVYIGAPYSESTRTIEGKETADYFIEWVGNNTLRWMSYITRELQPGDEGYSGYGMNITYSKNGYQETSF